MFRWDAIIEFSGYFVPFFVIMWSTNVLRTTRCSALADTSRQVRYSYLVSAVGVALVAISTVYGLVRAMLIREAPGTGAGFSGNRPFVNMNPFGFTSNLTILAVIVAVVGLIRWDSS